VLLALAVTREKDAEYKIKISRSRSLYSQPGSREWKWLAWIMPILILLALDRLVASLAVRRPVPPGVAQPPETALESCLLGFRIALGIFLFLLAYIGFETRI